MICIEDVFVPTNELKEKDEQPLLLSVIPFQMLFFYSGAITFKEICFKLCGKTCPRANGQRTKIKVFY